MLCQTLQVESKYLKTVIYTLKQQRKRKYKTYKHSSLWIKTDRHSYARPGELYLPKGYGNENDLESLLYVQLSRNFDPVVLWITRYLDQNCPRSLQCYETPNDDVSGRIGRRQRDVTFRMLNQV